MKKLFIGFSALLFIVLIACNGNDSKKQKATDSVVAPASGSLDSAANNGILPPSAAPGNAGNSSLADTSYHANDSTKSK